MFSPHLFTHKFDIDDLIAAMLQGQGPNQLAYLETVTGKLSATPPQADAKHTFHLEPLPLNWLAGLQTHDERFRLTEAEQVELTDIIQTTKNLEQLKPLIFGDTILGGWLRERVKEEALQWLADNNLIPPSMRHINGVPRARPKVAPEQGPITAKKVNIEPV
jgi:hypothetical protein